MRRNTVFMVAGHTKNRCDDALVFMKRKLKQRIFLTPLDMISLNVDNFEKHQANFAPEIIWIQWESFLESIL